MLLYTFYVDSNQINQQVNISLFTDVLFLCCLPTDWDLVLIVQCTVKLDSVMHVHFSLFVWLMTNCLVVFINWTWERHFIEITFQSSKQNQNLSIYSNMIRCSLFSGQEYTETEWNVYTYLFSLFVWLATFVFVCLIIK